MMRRYSPIAVIVIAVFALETGVFAQAAPVAAPEKVTVNRFISGSSLTPSSPGLSKRLGGSLQKPPPASRNWIKRHPVVFGTLVGLGAGFGMARYLVNDCNYPLSYSDNWCVPFVLLGGGIGTGAGAGLGFALSR